MRRILLASAPLAGFGLVAATWGRPELFRLLVAEDRVLEWLQVAGFAAASGGLVVLALRWRRHNRRLAGLALGWALLFAVVVGEELSWGQRHLDLSVDVIEAVNDQRDLTLHNIGAGFEASQVALMAVAIAGALLPTILRRRRVLLPGASADQSLPGWATPWFTAAAAFTAARLVVLGSPSYEVAKLSEVAETYVAGGAAATVLPLAARALFALGVPVGGFEGEGGHADREVARSRRARRAVAHPLPGRGEGGLAGSHLQASLVVFDHHGPVDHDGPLVEGGTLPGLGPTPRAVHSSDADLRGPVDCGTDELVDDLGGLAGGGNPQG